MGFEGGKAFFLVSESLDTTGRRPGAVAGSVGHPLEFVLESHPVLGCGPGKSIAVQLLFKGKPLADQRVSFIPRGATLAEGFDPAFERTDRRPGAVQLHAARGGQSRALVAATVVKPEEKGEGFEKTAYAATLVVNVPQRCPCCDE